ncbi:MAG: DUF6493 family protein [Gaiellaceae bacterium]
MSLGDDLEAAARRGDVAAVVELIENATEKERRAAASGTERFGIMRESPAWRLAWLGTATARDASTWWFSFDDLPPDDVLRVVHARGKRFVGTLVRAFERELVLWPLIRALVRRGLIDRPDLTAYTRALVRSAGAGPRFWFEDSAYRELVADEQLLDEDVWAIFEVDASSELASAHVYEQREQFTLGEPIGNRWLYALTRLASENRLDRQRLLDASLAALQRDFRASSVGWYAKLHEALEPTREERVARLGTYLALLASPVPAVVKEGVIALKQVEPPPEQLARSAAPALTLPQKGLALDVLRLLARAAKQEPAALATIAEALAHENVDVQERALTLLEQHREAVDRAALLRYAGVVSPTLRPRLEQLTGVALAEPVRMSEPPALRVRAQPRLTPREAVQRREPVTEVATVEDLIELAAALLEGQGTGDDAERFLDGVSRLWPEQEPGFDRRTGGLAKRAQELTADRRLVGISGAEIVARVVLAWTRGLAPPKQSAGGLIGFLGVRAIEVARRARGGGKPRGLLALPTNSGGWIDPDVLEERRARHGTFRNRPDHGDLQQAQLRASALEPIRIEPRLAMRERPFRDTERGVNLALMSVPAALGSVRDRLVPPEDEDSRTWNWNPWGISDALGIRWALTVLPGDPDAAFGNALQSAVVTRDGGSAYGHPEIVLEHALDPDVPMTMVGWHLVAAGLLGKPQEVKRAAVDVVVQTIEDGRFDAEVLAAAVGWLVANELGKPNRLEQPLRDVGRLSPLHAAQVVRVIVGVTAALPETPRALAAVLELARELSAASGYRVDGGAERSALERIAGEVSKSSKLGRAARALLGAPG